MVNDPDTSLSVLDGIRVGDQSAWSRFVSIYSPVLYEKCRRKGLSEADSRDVAQDAFLRVHKAIGGFEWNGKELRFRYWFSKVIKSAIIDFVRRSEKLEHAAGGTDMQVMLNDIVDDLDEETSFSDQDSDHVLIVRQALQVIKDDFAETVWQAFWLTSVEGVSATEAGEKLGITSNNVRQAKHRVKRRLAEQLDGLLDFAEPAPDK